MKVNRLDFLRILTIVESVGTEEVKFDKDGNFGVSFPDGTGLLFGKGIPLGKEISFFDMGILKKMLNSLSATEVMFTLDKDYLRLASKDAKFGYRLGDNDLVQSHPHSMMAEVDNDGWTWSTGSLSFEELTRVRKMAKALAQDKITFKDDGDKLSVVVGDEKMFFGEIEMGSLGLKQALSFEASKLDGVIGVLDEASIEVHFGARTVTDENTGKELQEGFVKLINGDFTWYIGSLQSK